MVLELPVRNVNRTVGTLLGSEVTRRYGRRGLPADTIAVELTGSAGRSIGEAFLPPGISIDLVGDANDYVGKGFRAARIVVRPPEDVLFLPGTTSSPATPCWQGPPRVRCTLRDRVGERFCAREPGRWPSPKGSATTPANT